MTTTIYDAERRDISIAVGGDAMITPPDASLPGTPASSSWWTSSAMPTFRSSTWRCCSTTTRAAGSGAAPPTPRSDPKNLDELKWMGINAVTTANNHSFDFSEGGFLTTLEHCRGR